MVLPYINMNLPQVYTGLVEGKKLKELKIRAEINAKETKETIAKIIIFIAQIHLFENYKCFSFFKKCIK